MADVRDVLALVDSIIQTPQTTAELVSRYGVSTRLLKSRLAQARTWGVDLHSARRQVNDREKLTGPYYWSVANTDDVQEMLNYWRVYGEHLEVEWGQLQTLGGTHTLSVTKALELISRKQPKKGEPS